jgi:hypothetical protein
MIVLPLKTLHKPPTFHRKFVNEVNNISPRRITLDRIAEVLNIKTPEDWYSVSKKQIIENGGGSVLRHYGTLLQGRV